MSRPWTPPTKEPDPLTAGINDFARLRLPRIFGQEINGAYALGRENVKLANGEDAMIELSATPSANKQFNNRASIIYALEGYAATRAAGFKARGQAVVDIKTHAFLDLTFELQPVGQVGGSGFSGFQSNGN